MRSCFLPDHVYFCFADDAAVFLDLKRNKYLGLDASHTASLRSLVASRNLSDGSLKDFGMELLKHGLLTVDSSAGKALTPVSVDVAESVLVSMDADLASTTTAGARLHHFRNLIVSYAIATFLWRCCPLPYMVRRMRARKERAGHKATQVDVRAAEELVRIFHHIRPLVYAAQNRCLVDTVTLLEFLARYGVFPTWVFGIKTRPFEAHTWVQHDGFVFNDHPARTKNYVPIAAI